MPSDPNLALKTIRARPSGLSGGWIGTLVMLGVFVIAVGLMVLADRHGSAHSTPGLPAGTKDASQSR